MEMGEFKECPMCGKRVAEFTSCAELEECENFESCDSEPFICVVCSATNGGCGATGGYAPSAEEAAKKWNRRADHSGEANGMMWISVKDRLPEDQGDVLVVAFWHERWQTIIGWFANNEKKWRILTPHGEREPGGVTHWMPLPQPPKEETE